MRPVWQRRVRGFTLIELLVAISLMALMALLSWRGLDGISRTQTSLLQRSDEVLTLQATLAQWAADLDAITVQPNLSGLDWDGRALRIVRHSRGAATVGLQVVAWAQRGVAGEGRWLRWQSPTLTTREDLDIAWQKAAVWAQTPSEEDRWREVSTVALDQWQVFYYRSNAWTNPLSSAGKADTKSVTVGDTQSTGDANNSVAQAGLPDGVRLVLTLSAGQAVSGVLTRDWASSLLGGGK